MTTHIRPMGNTDSEALIKLIGGVFSEYEGCVIDLDDLDIDLYSPASTLWKQDGDGWVAEDGDGTVIGCIGYVIPFETWFELKRLYVAPEHRGTGLAKMLLDLVETAVDARGGGTIELWSDTRFKSGHAFYLKHGYTMTGESRELHDPSNSTEYRFLKQI